MRFGYVTNGLSDHRIEDALELLAEHGYTGVALTLDHVHFDPFARDWAARAARLRNRLEALELDVVVETGARFLLDPHRKHFPTLLSEGRERRIEFLRRALDVAREIGAPVVSFWSGAGSDWERLVDGCARVLEHAGDVTLAFEPEPGMLVDTLTGYEELRRRLGEPQALGLTLDIGHIVCLEQRGVADTIRRAAPTLAHVHIEDMRRGVHEHLMFGEGELDLTEALGALAEVGYDGMVAVELSRHAHAAHEIVPAAMAALEAA